VNPNVQRMAADNRPPKLTIRPVPELPPEVDRRMPGMRDWVDELNVWARQTQEDIQEALTALSKDNR